MKLINILLKHITPEDWPEKYPFAAQDNSTGNVYFYEEKPGVNNVLGLQSTVKAYVKLYQWVRSGAKHCYP